MRKKSFRTLAAMVLIASLLTFPAFAEEATVSGSDVNMRSGPGTNYRVIDCLPDGAAVTVTDQSNSDWYAVSYNGQSGFISSQYLRVQNSGSREGDPQNVVAAAEANGCITAMYVRFRSGPSSDASVLGSYNTGKAVTITGVENGWTACIIDGRAGYVSSQYVSKYGSGGEVVVQRSSADSPSSDPYSGEIDEAPDGDVQVVPGGDRYQDTPEQEEPEAPSPAPSAPSPTPDDGVEVVPGEAGGNEEEGPEESPDVPNVQPTPETVPTDAKPGYIDGDFVRFRTGPSTSNRIIATYNRGKEVTITGTAGEWTACTIDGQSGYVFAQYVKERTSSEGETAGEPNNGESEGGEPNSGENKGGQKEGEGGGVVAGVEPAPNGGEPGYITGNNVRLRGAPSMSSDVLGELFYGNAVTITGTQGDWTAVTYKGKAGYVFSQYVSKGEYTPGAAGGGSDSDLGRQIADYALQFVGYRYTWGGTSPETGFDCSGLVYYVYKQFGYTLNRVANDQLRNGVHVDPSDLQPGDVLCFYSGGSGYCGHVGLYIGNGMFVHAASSNTGVIITSLSGYYSQRGYEARRIV